MKQKVISRKLLPAHIPVWPSVTLYLLLDKLSVPEWVWASVGTLWGLIVIMLIVAMITQESVDIFSKPFSKE